ncbi:hypothetical protein P43SY_005997 [Pythium insidiosum]|uniref:Uncharacterized protein n=1 Tax=Pythium insidiosum TaxID=114742 RepID=A0AAD5Q9A0_PYTIN|nr:hypothetical protein P43SY_005997 [Pythium insidiosum]
MMSTVVSLSVAPPFRRWAMTRPAFALLWVVIVVLHIAGTVYPCLIATLYLYLPVHRPRAINNAELYSVTVNRRYYKPIAATYFFIACRHAYTLLEITYYSLRHRRLLFVRPLESKRVSPDNARPSAGSSRQSDGPTTLHCRAPIPVPLADAQRRMSSRLATFSGHAISSAKAVWLAFDVTDRNYDAVHIIREMVQTGLLSFQAYKTSYLVARPWMNNVLVTLLVVNCWSTPLIKRVFDAEVFRARLLGLVVNIVLDLVSYVVIPVTLFMPYYENAEVITNYSFNSFWYTDRWLMRVLTEWQMLFVTSFWDGVSKSLIGNSVARALRELPKLIKPPSPSTSKTQDRSPQSRPTHQRMTQTLQAPVTRPVVRYVASRVERVGRHALLVWGLFIFVVHLHAASHKQNPQCASQVRPWFAQRASCSLLEIDCQRNARVGDATDFDGALAQIDAEWLSYLIVRHCAHVEITPQLLALRNLMGLKVYNATLARWDEDAVLTQSRHPLMMFVFLVATNMTDFPRGLYATADFPHLLTDIEVCRSNLTTLPDALATVWPADLFLLLEQVDFDGFPPVLARLRARWLSLAMNHFTSLPAALFENPAIDWIKLNGNPLESLPETIQRKGNAVRYLFIERTDVSSLPLWIVPESMIELRAGGTPLCQALKTSTAPLDARQAQILRRANCTTPKDVGKLYHYPIMDEAVNNP